MSARLRLVIGDDHHLVVEALRTTLKQRHQVVAVAYTVEEILAAVREHQPDVLLLDLSLGERNGLDIIPDVRRAAPLTRVIVVTMHLDRILADSCLAAGALGFVPKDAGLKELERAIHVVMRGAPFVSKSVPATTNRMTLLAAQTALAQLTPRQHEILKLLAEGRSYTEIARQLRLSESTVSFHRKRIMDRLGVDSTMGLLRYAVLLKLDGPDDASGDPTGLNRPGRRPEV